MTMPAWVRAVAWASRASGVAAAVLIAVAVVVICHMVFVRYVLGQATVWQTPFVIYALLAATFLGCPYVALTKGHVNVDLIPLLVRGRLRFVLALAATLLSLAFALVVVGYGAAFWWEVAEGGWRSSTVWRVPLWIPYLSLPLGIGLLALQYLADLFNLLSGREPPFAGPGGDH
jgi:TRAP-type C4-dicarboxylate transport system permease small subunit